MARCGKAVASGHHHLVCAGPFAYTSGPGYGLLLDERLPGWRTKLNAKSDLAALLGSTIRDQETVSAEDRASHYGASEIRLMEADRAAKGEAEKARYRALLVSGADIDHTQSR